MPQNHPSQTRPRISDVAVVDDLVKSGLTPNDLLLRDLKGPEKAALKAPANSTGYVIPYFDIYGKQTQFYRAKMTGGDAVRYRQEAGVPNSIYFPPHLRALQRALGVHCEPGFLSSKARAVLEKRTSKIENRGIEHDERPIREKIVLITEGEKKAAKGVKEGFLTVGLSGVDSWRTRTLLLPGDTTIKSIYGSRPGLQVRLPSTKESISEKVTLASGFEDLMDYLVAYDMYVVLAYDRDTENGLKYEVARAAAYLAYALRANGISATRIKLLQFPEIVGHKGKVGLDDYLLKEGPDHLEILLEELLMARNAFPGHPNPRSYVTNALNAGNTNREQTQNLSYAILSELDARGFRMYEKASREPYYFDETSLQLMPASLMSRHGAPIHETSFGQFLYRTFGLSSMDTKMFGHLASQFTGEYPTQEVDPRRIVARPEEGICIQISDGQFILVTGDPRVPFSVCNNGEYGVLFERDQVDDVDAGVILKKAFQELKQIRKDKEFKPKWAETIDKTNLKSQSQKDIATVLFYISPWLLRWNGLQLPIEVFLGEPGSGKSSLAALRLQIMTGRPTLRNVPNDLRDWNAAVGSSGGLHVVDNVHFTDKALRQRLSDELCRLTTEPDPHVEMRKLYTTADTIRVPVRCAFALTAIYPPFQNSDFLQRAIIFEMQKSEESYPDSEWVQKQLASQGGREGWLAHHLVFLHKFLYACEHKGAWKVNKRVKHRLIHFELAMSVAADLLGIDSERVTKHLMSMGEGQATHVDWALEGLSVFAKHARDEEKKSGRTEWCVSDMSEWLLTHPDFGSAELLTNSRRLGRYLNSNISHIRRLTGISQSGKKSNKMYYIVKEPEIAFEEEADDYQSRT